MSFEDEIRLAMSAKSAELEQRAPDLAEIERRAALGEEGSRKGRAAVLLSAAPSRSRSGSRAVAMASAGLAVAAALIALVGFLGSGPSEPATNVFTAPVGDSDVPAVVAEHGIGDGGDGDVDDGAGGNSDPGDGITAVVTDDDQNNPAPSPTSTPTPLPTPTPTPTGVVLAADQQDATPESTPTPMPESAAEPAAGDPTATPTSAQALLPTSTPVPLPTIPATVSVLATPTAIPATATPVPTAVTLVATPTPTPETGVTPTPTAVGQCPAGFFAWVDGLCYPIPGVPTPTAIPAVGSCPQFSTDINGECRMPADLIPGQWQCDAGYTLGASSDPSVGQCTKAVAGSSTLTCVNGELVGSLCGVNLGPPVEYDPATDAVICGVGVMEADAQCWVYENPILTVTCPSPSQLDGEGCVHIVLAVQGPATCPVEVGVVQDGCYRIVDRVTS